MAKQKYNKPEINSSSAFTLTSAGCDTNEGSMFCSSSTLIWGGILTCEFIPKVASQSESCTPHHPPTQES